jgi:hypothetical protein
METPNKTCETCIFWKRYMLRSLPNTTFADDTFPCQHESIQQLPTDEYYNVCYKTKDDKCDNWKLER